MDITVSIFYAKEIKAKNFYFSDISQLARNKIMIQFPGLLPLKALRPHQNLSQLQRQGSKGNLYKSQAN